MTLLCLDHSADDKQFAAAVGLEFRLPEVSQTPCSSRAPLRGPLVTQDIFGPSAKANAAAAELTGPNSTLGLSALCESEIFDGVSWVYQMIACVSQREPSESWVSLKRRISISPKQLCINLCVLHAHLGSRSLVLVRLHGPLDGIHRRSPQANRRKS